MFIKNGIIGITSMLLMTITTIICFIFCMSSIFILRSKKLGVWFYMTWSKLIMLETFCTITKIGMEHIVKGKCYLVISNHKSYIDIPCLTGSLGIDLKFVAKTELKKHVVFGPSVKALDMIFIDRNNTQSSIESLKASKNLITNGKCVLMFVEGKRSEDNKILPFKKGAFHIASEMDIEILPVILKNTNLFWKKKTWLISPCHIKIKVLKPFKVDKDQINEITKSTYENFVKEFEMLE